MTPLKHCSLALVNVDSIEVSFADKSAEASNFCFTFAKAHLFQLWEESQAENARLRLDMNAIRSDLDSTRHQLEAAIQVFIF